MSDVEIRQVDGVATRVFVAVLALGTAMLFAVATNHAWEDWYITYRSSRNFAEGNGLVYTVGERVQSFTSPLGTLIPALIRFAIGNGSDESVLWIYRVVSAASLAAACVTWLRIASAWRLSRLASLMFVGLIAFDAKTVDFTINGMETGLMVLALMLNVRALAESKSRMGLRLGVAWGALMWIRPDGFVYAGALAIGWILFVDAGRRGELLRQYSIAAAVAAVVYLPWLLATTFYYETPIPNTITAKGLLNDMASPGTLWAFLKFPLALFLGSTSAGHTFMPPYFDFGGWPYAAYLASKGAALASAFYWCVPAARAEARAVSFAVFLSHFYLSRVAAYPAPWYVPSVTVLSIVVLAPMLQQFGEWFDRNVEEFGGWAGVASPAAMATVAIVFQFVMMVMVGYEMRVQQSIIENGNRKRIGLWLKEHSGSPNDTVFLEPLGYIGFFSNLKMLDVPGLASPEVVAARRKLNTNDMDRLIAALAPKWLVLRRHEIEKINETSPNMLSTTYRRVGSFDVTREVEARTFLPGRSYLQGDQYFAVFERVPVAGAPSQPGA